MLMYAHQYTIPVATHVHVNADIHCNRHAPYGFFKPIEQEACHVSWTRKVYAINYSTLVGHNYDTVHIDIE